MCATYKNNGFPKTMAFEMLKDVAERQGKRTDTEPHSAKEIWNNIVNSVYSPHWVGGIYSDKTDPLLIEIAQSLNLKPDLDTALNNMTIGELKNKFVDYAKNITQNTVKFGIKEIDDNVFISTGMAVGILGAPGASKSTWAYNISENLSNNEQLVLFHQMDMFDAATYARLIGKHNNYSMKQCLEKILNGDIDESMTKSFEEVEKRFRNVIFDFRTGLTVEDIEQSLIDTEQKMGTKVKLLVVDYLEKIRGPYSDDTANSGFIAARLSDIAKKHNVCVLILLQPQKIAGDPREELLTYTKIKGSGKIQQDLRVVMTIWRPGYNPRDNANDKYVSMEVVKNNMGGLHHFDFNWDGVRGEIKSMTKEEKVIFKSFLERLKEEKAEEERQRGFNPFA
jgi:replicative DNA helicase